MRLQLLKIWWLILISLNLISGSNWNGCSTSRPTRESRQKTGWSWGLLRCSIDESHGHKSWFIAKGFIHDASFKIDSIHQVRSLLDESGRGKYHIVVFRKTLWSSLPFLYSGFKQLDIWKIGISVAWCQMLYKIKFMLFISNFFEIRTGILICKVFI